MKSFGEFVMEGFTPVPDTQYGSNEGGLHTDEGGVKHYIKYYRNPDQAKVEALTGKIYEHMGIRTLKPEHHVIGGRHAVVTKWNDSLSSVKPHEFNNVSHEQAKDLAKMHYGAVLTKNWDIVGLVHDNIMKDKEGRMVSVDHGGSFHFRARGTAKDYGPDIAEKESLRTNGDASGHVFSSLYRQHPYIEEHAKEAVRSIDDEHIKNLFETSGLHNQDVLHKHFKARKAALLKS